VFENSLSFFSKNRLNLGFFSDFIYMENFVVFVKEAFLGLFLNVVEFFFEFFLMTNVIHEISHTWNVHKLVFCTVRVG